MKQGYWLFARNQVKETLSPWEALIIHKSNDNLDIRFGIQAFLS